MNPKNFENMLNSVYDIYSSRRPSNPYQEDLAYCEADVEAMKSVYDSLYDTLKPVIIDTVAPIENNNSIKYIIPDDQYIFLVYSTNEVIKMLKSDYDLNKDDIQSMSFTQVCHNYGIVILNMEEITC